MTTIYPNGWTTSDILRKPIETIAIYNKWLSRVENIIPITSNINISNASNVHTNIT